MLTLSSFSSSFSVADFPVDLLLTVFDVEEDALAVCVSEAELEYESIVCVVSEVLSAVAFALSSAHFWQLSLSSLQETKIVADVAIAKKNMDWYILLARVFI